MSSGGAGSRVAVGADERPLNSGGLGLDGLVTVVVPTLNEEKAIGKVIDELLAVGVPARNILVVDGGSTDKTREIAASRGARVVLQEGRGKADAVRTAVRHVDTPFAVFMDGDYTYPAAHVPELLEKAVKENQDQVIGARIMGRDNIPAINRVGNKALNKIFNFLFGTKLRDVLSGMYLVRVAALRNALFEMKGFSVEAEIAAHVASTSGRISEIPISYRRRIGCKKLKVLDGVRIGLDMVRLAWRYNPTFFIFGLGALLMLPGLALGGWVAYHYMLSGVKYYVKGLVAVLLTLFGFQSLLMSVMALYVKRVEQRMTKKLEEIAQPQR